MLAEIDLYFWGWIASGALIAAGFGLMAWRALLNFKAFLDEWNAVLEDDDDAEWFI